LARFIYQTTKTTKNGVGSNTKFPYKKRGLWGVLIHTPERMGKVRGEVEEAEGEAIEALGSLFKLTQIHLW